MAFSEKTDLLNLIKAKSCPDADRLSVLLETYADCADYLIEYSKTFDCDTAYLESLLDLFSTSDLNDNDIYYNQSVAEIDDPRYVAKCTVTLISITANIDLVEIADNSTIDKIVVSGTTTVGAMVIASGSTVTSSIEVSADCEIDLLHLKTTCDPAVIATVNLAKGDGKFLQVVVDEDSVFGGFECVLPAP